MAAKNLSNSTLGMLYKERRRFHVSEMEVKELWNSIAPFVTIVANARTVQVPDPDFKMLT